MAARSRSSTTNLHLRDFRLPSKVLRNFYTYTIESILTGNITVWFGNSTKQDRQALQRVVHSAEHITHTELPDLQTISYKRCQTKARRIVKDPTHPNNRLFSLLRAVVSQWFRYWTSNQKVVYDGHLAGHPTLYLRGLDVLNLSALAHGGAECLCVPVQDLPHAPLERHFDSVAERIHGNHSGSSLVCCSAGRSRSPALVMA
ncbi:hypothetical protein P4O66_014820 [Electrophorus voltai]|uniref:Uncharacterized protein n=1 Tax=Electrophorus voltai TaxID=2609070 RepID=A0AAD9DQ11_9TELE|nr:hypothetical protein P4O66_014820 [Electrophorus voltai]